MVYEEGEEADALVVCGGGLGGRGRRGYVGRVVIVLGDTVGDGLLLRRGGGSGSSRIDGLGGMLRLLHGHLAVEEG